MDTLSKTRFEDMGAERAYWIMAFCRYDMMATTTALRSYWCSMIRFGRGALYMSICGCRRRGLSDESEHDFKWWVRYVLPSHQIPEPEWTKWGIERYRASVWAVTRKQPIHELPGFSLRGNGWELDHFISVKEGHRLGHSPEFIGNIKNLRMVCFTQNRAKSGRAMYHERSDAEDSLHQ